MMLPQPLRYLPFSKGIYSTAPGLLVLDKAELPEDRLVFQIDRSYEKYIENKKVCRKEAIGKYYCEERFSENNRTAINKYLVAQFLKEHPDVFIYDNVGGRHTFTNSLNNEIINWNDDWANAEGSKYLSLFDALCCQVQEDVAVCQLEGEKDWLAALHLCAPNHWAAEDKIGKPFDFVHAHVPGMEKTMPHYFSMLTSIVNKGPFTRFAWGIATDDRLNHHPIAPLGTDAHIWQGRSFDAETANLYLRVERQNLVGFPAANAFLFTIRTYFYDVSSLSRNEKSLLMMAVDSMSENSLVYKGLSGKKEILRACLKL